MNPLDKMLRARRNLSRMDSRITSGRSTAKRLRRWHRWMRETDKHEDRYLTRLF